MKNSTESRTTLGLTANPQNPRANPQPHDTLGAKAGQREGRVNLETSIESSPRKT
jgi:hypothetical protein